MVVLGKPAAVASADGTPEQIHLTFGDDPTSSVVVSWASPAQAVNPRVLLERAAVSPRVVHALQRTYTDGLNGQTVFTYHAVLDALAADSAYRYSVTADNDQRKGAPFASSFRTAPRGRSAFRGHNVQRSAANRPWMPCPGNHEIEFCNGEQGLTAYLTRFTLPDNGTAFPGRWYRFRVGSALFISLAADDVICQDR
jgi:hypothetical protein